MRTYIGIGLLLGCLFWPAPADLADIQPIVQYVLPADIMQVDFVHETWVYRLYEDGTVKKVVSKRSLANRDTEKNETVIAANPVSPFSFANPFL